jgi:hypothetical protein
MSAPRLVTVLNLSLLASFGKDLNAFSATIILILLIDKIDGVLAFGVEFYFSRLQA